MIKEFKITNNVYDKSCGVVRITLAFYNSNGNYIDVVNHLFTFLRYKSMRRNNLYYKEKRFVVKTLFGL